MKPAPPVIKIRSVIDHPRAWSRFAETVKRTGERLGPAAHEAGAGASDAMY
jgi:hypothetical protein